MLSVPLTVGGPTIGAMNVYADISSVSVDDALHARVASLAGYAAATLAITLRLAQRDELIIGLRQAMASRSTIDHAIGIVMAQQRCGADTAFRLLRDTSQQRNIKVRDLATTIVDGVNNTPPSDTR